MRRAALARSGTPRSSSDIGTQMAGTAPRGRVCWSEVIPLLQRAGLNVAAVQNPLTSLADDVEATRRILALQDGPTVLVGRRSEGLKLDSTILGQRALSEPAFAWLANSARPVYASTSRPAARRY